MTQSNSERRNEERREVCLDAICEGESGNYNARVTDLSEGGCYIDTLSEACVGEVLNFKLRLPADEWLCLTGEVAHQAPPMGFGVRFINLTDTQREKLRSLTDDAEPLTTPFLPS